MDRPFMRVIWLGQVAQEHCCGSDVLTGLSEVWRIDPSVRGVALDQTCVTLGAACRSMRVGRSVVRRACMRSRWLMRPLLS